MTSEELDKVIRVTLWNPKLKDTYSAEDILECLEMGVEFDRICPYCGSTAHIKPASKVYGASSRIKGEILLCDNFPRCNSYVGVHSIGPNKGEPLGTMANPKLRELRKICHNEYFDPLWNTPGATMDRKEAYQFLRTIMGLPSTLAHISMFNNEQCENFIHLMKTRETWDLDYAKRINAKGGKLKNAQGWEGVPAPRKKGIW